MEKNKTNGTLYFFIVPKGDDEDNDKKDKKAPKLNIIISGLLLLLSCNCIAQTDSQTSLRDSAHRDLLLYQSGQLRELETARIEDSVKKVELQNQINTLTTADNVKKQELLEELEQIKNKEVERLAVKRAKIDSLRGLLHGHPVVPFFSDTLFFIYNKLGSLSSEDRADAVTNRIKKLADNFYFKTDSLSIVPSETTVDIVFGESIIMSIGENDALWQNLSKENLATRYKLKIGIAVMHYKSATSWQTISKQIGLAALVLAILFAVIYFISKLFRLLRLKIEDQKKRGNGGLKIRNYELFNANSLLRFYAGVLNILKWIVIITAVYLTLPILFSIFPWTKGFANILFSYFTNPVKKIIISIWKYLPNLFTIAVIVFLFRYIIKGFHFLKVEIEKGALQIPGFYADWAAPIFQIIKMLLYAFMFVLIFPYLPGSNSPIFQGVSVFLGVLFTFGSSGSLSNVVAGLVLTYMRAFKIGDRVKIGDIAGDVIEKSLLVTRVRTIKNEIISIPNSNVMNSHTVNYSSDAVDKGLIMHSTVTIGYDVPWKTMHQALIDAALRTEFLLKDPAPFVLQTSLDDFYVSYQINGYTREPNKQALIYSLLHQNIQDCCNEMGIEIMSPHYRAARDGNLSTIPSDYLPKDYITPSFRVTK